MSNSKPRSTIARSRSRVYLHDLPVDGSLWEKAWRSHLDEDYASSLEAARACLDQIDGGIRQVLKVVPGQDAPTVEDAVVLCARNLYQMDRHQDFEVLLASAGRWGMVAEESAALDAVRLSFANKRGEYPRVVKEAGVFIDRNRQSLPPAIADFLYLRGLAFSHLGEPERARDDAEAAFSLFRVLGREHECARTANLLGVIAFRGAEFADALKWFRRAHDLHSRLGMIKNMGGNRLNMGISFYKQGLFCRALSELRSAIRLLEEVGAGVSLCRAGIALGNTLRLTRDFDGARKQLQIAYELANALTLSREEGLALEFLGDLYRDQGQIDQARRFYSRALAIGRSIAPEGDLVMEVLRRQGECLGMRGRHSEAVAVLGRALSLARRLGDRFEEGVIRRVLSSNLLGVGDLESSLTHGQEAVRILEEVGAGHELAIARMHLVSVHRAHFDSGQDADLRARIELAWESALIGLDLFLKQGVQHRILEARRVLADLSGLKEDLDQARRSAAPSLKTSWGRRNLEPIIHTSSKMRDLIQLTDAFADSEEPVLITGETGTGKELFARRLHHKSGRKNRELVSVNVSAIPESIFGREFFGHVRGSFSGADRDGKGLAAQADGGTLFLDEIGDLPLELQPQLLRLLQDGSYQAIGDPSQRRTDIRLVAATNRDLEQLVAEGKFRADLYYRLKILELRLPPVVDRREDVFPLLRHFLSEAEGLPVEPSAYFNLESLQMAKSYHWPGNVREIAMVARQARVQLRSRGLVRVEIGGNDRPDLVLTGPDSGVETPVAMDADSDDGRGRILMALAESNGNRARAAKQLGISRSTLYRQMDRLGIAGKAVSG